MEKENVFPIVFWGPNWSYCLLHLNIIIACFVVLWWYWIQPFWLIFKCLQLCKSSHKFMFIWYSCPFPNRSICSVIYFAILKFEVCMITIRVQLWVRSLGAKNLRIPCVESRLMSYVNIIQAAHFHFCKEQNFKLNYKISVQLDTRRIDQVLILSH